MPSRIADEIVIRILAMSVLQRIHHEAVGVERSVGISLPCDAL